MPEDSPASALPRKKFVIEIDLPDLRNSNDEPDETLQALYLARVLYRLTDRLNNFGVLYANIKLEGDDGEKAGEGRTVLCGPPDRGVTCTKNADGSITTERADGSITVETQAEIDEIDKLVRVLRNPSMRHAARLEAARRLLATGWDKKAPDAQG